MPIIQGGPAMSVVVDTSGQRVEGGSAIPVAVVTGRATQGGKAQRVVVVTNPDKIEGGPAIPVVAAAPGDTAVEGGPAMRVYVVSGSLSGGAVVVPSSLLTGLVAYWALEEASGTRADATGRGNTLSPTNAPGNAAGIVSNGLSLLAGSSQYVSRASTTDLQTGAIDFTYAGWVKLTAKTSFRMIASKYGAGAAETLLYYDTSDRFAFQTYTLAEVSLGNAKANTFGSPSTGVWYFLCAQQVAAGPTLKISVNNGAFDSVTPTGTPSAGSGVFQIGAYRGGTLPNGDMTIDEFGIWKRILTGAEITALYNAGAGRTYPFVGT